MSQEENDWERWDEIGKDGTRKREAKKRSLRGYSAAVRQDYQRQLR